MSKINTRPFDIANYLASKEDMAEYLRQVIEENDPAELAGALDAIARVHDMALGAALTPALSQGERESENRARS